jgi:hypothetical protein
MLLVNARADGTAPDAFAPTDQVRDTDARRRSARGPLPSSPLQVAGTVRDRRVLVLVHGLNYAVGDAIALFRRIEQTFTNRFPDAYDEIGGFTWPSGASAVDYFSAKGRVEEAGRRLRRWLDALWAAGCTIDLACHSLGARVATAALRNQTAPRLANAFVLGAAVGPDALGDVHGAADQVYIFHTRRDVALGRWYWLFEWETPLGYAGLEADPTAASRWPNVTTVDCTDAVPDHQSYHASDAVLNFLGDVLDQPPAERTVRLGEPGASEEGLDASPEASPEGSPEESPEESPEGSHAEAEAAPAVSAVVPA